MKIEFTIHGNQENPKGNPIPYHRATQKSTWSPEAKRYEAWKSYVQENFRRLILKIGFINEITDETPEEIRTRLSKGKVIKPIFLRKKKMHTDIFIHWANHAHGDPDNILKGINDALFQNDKLVAGSVDFAEKPTGEGKVEVMITI